MLFGVMKHLFKSVYREEGFEFGGFPQNVSTNIVLEIDGKAALNLCSGDALGDLRKGLSLFGKRKVKK
jgi:hypothetical protein